MERSPSVKGFEGEALALKILQDEGFQDIKWLSKEDNMSAADFQGTKDGNKFLIEVRYRYSSTGWFTIQTEKIDRIRRIANEESAKVMILLIAKEGKYQLLSVENSPLKPNITRNYRITNPIKRSGQRQFSIRMEEAMIKNLDQLSRAIGKDRSDLVREAVGMFMAEYTGEPDINSIEKRLRDVESRLNELNAKLHIQNGGKIT